MDSFGIWYFVALVWEMTLFVLGILYFLGNTEYGILPVTKIIFWRELLLCMVLVYGCMKNHGGYADNETNIQREISMGIHRSK